MMFMKFWLSVFTCTLLLINVKGIEILFSKKNTCIGCDTTLLCRNVQGNASWLLNDILINENEKYSIRKEESNDQTFLTIHNLTISDEGNYICQDEESNASKTIYGELCNNIYLIIHIFIISYCSFCVVMPNKIETDNESLIVYPESSFTIDCGIEIGIESQKCLIAKLRHDESDDDLNSPNYSFNGNMQNPSFTVLKPNTAHNSYFCLIRVDQVCIDDGNIDFICSKHYFISCKYPHTH